VRFWYLQQAELLTTELYQSYEPEMGRDIVFAVAAWLYTALTNPS
jgi:hypothetical protein